MPLGPTENFWFDIAVNLAFVCAECKGNLEPTLPGPQCNIIHITPCPRCKTTTLTFIAREIKEGDDADTAEG